MARRNNKGETPARHAMEEFIGWYRSEPRLPFSRTVVLRYRFFLKQKNLAPSTINVRLAGGRD